MLLMVDTPSEMSHGRHLLAVAEVVVLDSQNGHHCLLLDSYSDVDALDVLAKAQHGTTLELESTIQADQDSSRGSSQMLTTRDLIACEVCSN